jgi:hypothetical protein
VTVNFDRQMYGLKGSLIAVMLGLMAKQAFRSNFLKTVAILEQEPAAA